MPSTRRVRIRRRVAGASLATFAIAWGVIAGSGSMGATTHTARNAAAPSARWTARGDGGWDQSAGAGTEQSQSSDLTTRQS